MNSREYCLYHNMMVIIATVLAVWISGTAWAMLGFLFMIKPCCSEDKVKDEENE